MAEWKIVFKPKARKSLYKLGTAAQRDILRYLRERIACEADPRRFGKGLTGNKLGLWRYRTGDYRIICKIEDDKITVLVLAVGHRKDIYE